MLDFPDKTACIFWFAGCNMRCPYCYNPEIVLGKGKLSYQEALDFLDSRKGLLDGVVLSGGEATMHKNLVQVIKQIRAKGFEVKLDTNGSNPNMVKDLLEENLLNYVALDFKALPGNYQKVTQTNLFNQFEESLDILLKGDLPFEVRTTVHSSLIDLSEINKMIKYLDQRSYSGTYYLQQFREETPVLGNIEQSSERIKEELLSNHQVRVKIRN